MRIGGGMIGGGVRAARAEADARAGAEDERRMYQEKMVLKKYQPIQHTTHTHASSNIPHTCTINEKFKFSWIVMKKNTCPYSTFPHWPLCSSSALITSSTFPSNPLTSPPNLKTPTTRMPITHPCKNIKT